MSLCLLHFEEFQKAGIIAYYIIAGAGMHRFIIQFLSTLYKSAR
jgi:hypothetical protein